MPATAERAIHEHLPRLRIEPVQNLLRQNGSVTGGRRHRSNEYTPESLSRVGLAHHATELIDVALLRRFWWAMPILRHTSLKLSWPWRRGASRLAGKGQPSIIAPDFLHRESLLWQLAFLRMAKL